MRVQRSTAVSESVYWWLGAQFVREQLMPRRSSKSRHTTPMVP